MEGLPDCGSIMDTFGIDDLLDFSNEDIAGAIGDLDDDTMQQQLSAESSLTVETVSCNFSATGNNNSKSRASPAAASPAAAATGISSLIEKDFCVPYEDMVELEWLSNFVEDSFSAGNASHSNNILGFSTAEEQKQHSGQQQQQQQQQQHQLSSTNNSSKQHHFHMLSPVSVLESSATSERVTGEAEVVLPSKARSKRGRPGSNSSASSSYEEEEEETSDAHESDCALSTESEVMTEEHELEWPPRKRPPPPAKRQCLKESSDGGGGGGGGSAAAGRRCSHCLTQRTPQWRAGPLGPKTLCNACGVRFKSGRLLPEYRPAGSPTFVADKHSNSHRKVLEMRKQREEVASTVKRLQEAEGELEEEEVILLS